MIAMETADRVATLVIDRGGARNAVPIAGWDAIADAARAIDAVAIDAVVIASAISGSFSAGADLSEFDRLRECPEARVRFRTAMRGAIEAVAALSMPVIAAIDGGCYGAAVALTLACDVRAAGDAATFAITPAKLGIGYPGEDVARLIGLVGPGQAARMLLAAEPIDADEAARIGLAELRAPSARDAADALARRIAGNDAAAVRLLKRSLADPLRAGHAGEFDAAFGSSGFADRLAAFRAPRR